MYTPNIHACTNTHNSQPQDRKGKAQKEDHQHQQPSKGPSLIANSSVDLVVAGGTIDRARRLTKPVHEGMRWSEIRDKTSRHMETVIIAIHEKV